MILLMLVLVTIYEDYHTSLEIITEVEFQGELCHFLVLFNVQENVGKTMST